MLLNRRILEIQKYRTDMLRLFKEFDKTVAKSDRILTQTEVILSDADKNINHMQNNIETKTKNLGFLLEKADKLSDELEMIITSGNRLFNRLSLSTSQYQNLNESELNERGFEGEEAVNNLVNSNLPFDDALEIQMNKKKVS
ncbi:MAG: hypothetical protein SFT91_05765 [Rickettsiaceae bacterium]|nr:hypothetical protein [Rickettsiaceae bacterium]